MDDYKRLHAAIDEARATTERANAVAETVKSLNDPESIGRAAVQAILLDEQASSQWGDIARVIAGQKRSMDEGAKDERTALAEAMERYETELRGRCRGGHRHRAPRRHAGRRRLGGRDGRRRLLPDEVFIRKPDRNRIGKRFKEHGRCPGARLVRGKRYVQIRLKSDGTSRRGNGRNEAGEANNE